MCRNPIASRFNLISLSRPSISHSIDIVYDSWTPTSPGRWLLQHDSQCCHCPLTSHAGVPTGDGTGKILGIDSGIEAIVFLAVFALIWVLYFNSQKDLDAGRDGGDDGGLSL